MPNRNISLAAALALSSLLLAGCDKKPAKPVGDVVATVNGRPITVRDLNAEARARGVRFDTREGDTARAAILEFLVARTALVDGAVKARLDRTPAVLADRLRADANILAQAQVAKLTSGMRGATGPEIATFRAQNPQIFAQRQALTVDQVRVPADANLPKVTITSNEQLTELLLKAQVRSQSDRATIDSANLPRATVAQLLARPGVPVRIENGPQVAFLTLVSAKPVPTPEPLQVQAATQLLQRQNFDKRVAAEVENLRKAGRITYREGYAPKK